MQYKYYTIWKAEVVLFEKKGPEIEILHQFFRETD